MTTEAIAVYRRDCQPEAHAKAEQEGKIRDLSCSSATFRSQNHVDFVPCSSIKCHFDVIFSKSQAVKWSEDVVDNEFLNKKSSKSKRPGLCSTSDSIAFSKVSGEIPLRLEDFAGCLIHAVLAARVLHIPQAAAIW